MSFYVMIQIDELVQRRYSNVLAMELRSSNTNTSKCDGNSNFLPQIFLFLLQTDHYKILHDTTAELLWHVPKFFVVREPGID